MALNDANDPDPDPEDETTSSDFGTVHTNLDEALKDKPPLQKDPGETAPEIPDDVDPTKADPYGNRSPLTPEERMKLQLEQYKRSQAALNALHARTAPMWEKYRQMLQEDQNQLMQGDGSLDQKMPQMPQQQKQSWMGAITQLLAVAVPVAMMFGIKGNGFAKGAMMSALGSFMTSYAKGKTEAAKESWVEYKDQVEAIKASNQERHELYKEVLANKRLALNDQFAMINSMAQQFGDPTMAKASRTKDMRAIIEHMQNQGKVKDRFNKGTAKLPKTIRPQDWAEYRLYMINRHNIDPDTDFAESQKIEDYTSWHTGRPTTATKSREQKKEEEEKEEEAPNAPTTKETRDAVFPPK